MAFTAPVPLDDRHRLEHFRCASPELARWLIERARKNQSEGASRCFVVANHDADVVGYYALAAGAVSHGAVPGNVKRNMPDPIPVAVLARLAVHQDWSGQGIGRGLIKDALLRALTAAQYLGVRALLCHAIDDSAKAFYLRHKFVESPIDSMTLILNLPRDMDGLRISRE